MSIFARHIDQRGDRMDDALAADAATAITDNDPLANAVDQTDTFAQERLEANARLGIAAEDLTQENEPVDGDDEDMKVGKSDSDAEVAEGEYGVEFTSEEDAEDEELDVVEGEHADIEQLEQRMHMLDGSYVAVEAHGINPTAMGLLSTFGLLNGTALETMGMEDLGYRGPGDQETELALENLGEKIKDTAAAWGAKIMSFAKNSGTKILDVLGGIWTKISTTAQSLASASWEKAKDAGREIKAHPVKSLLTAAAAVGAVAAVVALCTTGCPAIASRREVVVKFGQDVVNKIRNIKLPFGGKITAEVAENGAPKVGFAAFDAKARAIQAANVTKLGWGKAAVNTVLSTFNRSWSALKDAWTGLAAKIVKVATAGSGAVVSAAKAVGAGASRAGNAVKGGAGAAAGLARKGAERAAGQVALHTHGVTHSLSAGNYMNAAKSAWALSGVIGLVAMVFKLTRYVVVGAFRMLLRTFGVLKAEAA